jgi:hypothetical protein
MDAAAAELGSAKKTAVEVGRDQPAPRKGVRFLFEGKPVSVEGAKIEATAPSAPHVESTPKQPRSTSAEIWQSLEEADEEHNDPAYVGRAGPSQPAGEGRPQRERRPPQLGPGMVRWEDIGAQGLSAIAVEYCFAAAAAEGIGMGESDPKTLSEALDSPDREQWIDAVKDELKAMRHLHVWDRVHPSTARGQRAIGCKWVFRRKFDKDGVVTRWKARLCAQGFAQREGVDFKETYAPVLHYKTLRVLLAIVAALGYELLQMDVPTAFLNATCHELVLMRPPPGMAELGLNEDGVGQDWLCKLNKTLYGIKQAPREWNIHFNNSIVALGYKRCSSDTCVYVRTSKTGRSMILPVFVDDVFPACHPDDLAELREDLARLMKQYNIPQCEEAGAILGMRVTRDKKARVLRLDQQVYINKLLQQYGLADCNPAATPEEERPACSQEVEEMDDGWRDRYGSIVGALLYIALSTRPDIAHATSTRARAVSNPTHADWLAAKRVLRYLKGTASMGLTFGLQKTGGAYDGSTSPPVTLGPCACDANWGGDVQGRRSTTGYVMRVCGSVVS